MPREPQITHEVLERRMVRSPRSRTPGRQQTTRIPPFRPGEYVKLKRFAEPPGSSLSGRVLRVRSLTCAITSADQIAARWLIHFDNGRHVEWHQVERMATQTEVRAIEGQMRYTPP